MVFVRGSETARLASLKVKMNHETTNGDIQKADEKLIMKTFRTL